MAGIVYHRNEFLRRIGQICIQAGKNKDKIRFICNLRSRSMDILGNFSFLHHSRGSTEFVGHNGKYQNDKE